MNVELKRIAEKKLEQMGATVHGVLVKNEAGAWAAVSDAGRVMWLDGFEGRADETRATIMPSEHGKNRYGLDMAYFRELFNRELNRPLVDFRPDELARVLARAARTADAAVLQEPEFQAARAQSRQGAEAVAVIDRSGVIQPMRGAEGLAEGDKLYTHPQPAKQGGVPGWVKCSERLPTEKDADSEGQVWAYLGATGSEDVYLRRPGSVRELYYNDCATHWKPTGLKRPQPPKEGE